MSGLRHSSQDVIAAFNLALSPSRKYYSTFAVCVVRKTVCPYKHFGALSHKPVPEVAVSSWAFSVAPGAEVDTAAPWRSPHFAGMESVPLLGLSAGIAPGSEWAGGAWPSLYAAELCLGFLRT